MDTTSVPPEVPANKGVEKSPSKKQLINTVEKIISSGDPLEFIERNRIDLNKIYLGLYDIALHAMSVAKDRDGDVMELGADNRSRIMASTLLLELAKHIKDKNVIIAQGIFNDPKMVEKVNGEAERVLKLKNRL